MAVEGEISVDIFKRTGVFLNDLADRIFQLSQENIAVHGSSNIVFLIVAGFFFISKSF